MNPFRRVSICLTLSLLLLGPGEAVNLVFTPTSLNINPARTLNTSTTVQNRDSAPVEFTAEVMRWTQQGGKDVLEPTPEALVSLSVNSEVIVSPLLQPLAPGVGQHSRFLSFKAETTLTLRQKGPV